MRASKTRNAAFAVFFAAALIGASAGAAIQRSAPTSEPLYFALEVRQGGRLLAHPKLLGEAGKTLRVERRQPGAVQPEYRFSLLPVRSGDKYQVDFALKLPDAEGHSALALLPGEVRRVELGPRPGELEVSLLLMKVDSPEFRALMDLASQRAKAQGHGSI